MILDTILGTIHALIDLAAVPAYTETDGDAGWLLLLGPAGAFAVYMGLYRYYRNTDKSHAYERETLIESQPATGRDTKVGEVKGTKRSSIEGNNVREYRRRVERIRE